MPDLAAISIAAIAIILFVLLGVQFFLWLRVKFEIKTSIMQWEHMVQSHTASAQALPEIRNELAAMKGESKRLDLQQMALEESFRHMNAKTQARERQLNATLQKEEKAKEKAIPEDPNEAIFAALKAQGGFPPGFPVPPGFPAQTQAEEAQNNTRPRLRPKVR